MDIFSFDYHAGYLNMCITMGLKGAQIRQSNHLLNACPGRPESCPSWESQIGFQLHPPMHALLMPHTHHLLFPLGAAHNRDLLIKELDGVVHAC